MGRLAHLLKNWENHSPEKVLIDTVKICFRNGIKFEYQNWNSYFSNGSLKNTEIRLEEDSKNDEKQGFLLSIQGVDIELIEIGQDKAFDYLIPNKNLCSLAYIEPVWQENLELIFLFIYEYLNINRDDYFWFEGEDILSWESIQNFKKDGFEIFLKFVGIPEGP